MASPVGKVNFSNFASKIATILNLPDHKVKKIVLQFTRKYLKVSRLLIRLLLLSLKQITKLEIKYSKLTFELENEGINDCPKKFTSLNPVESELSDI